MPLISKPYLALGVYSIISSVLHIPSVFTICRISSFPAFSHLTLPFFRLVLSHSPYLYPSHFSPAFYGTLCFVCFYSTLQTSPVMLLHCSPKTLQSPFSPVLLSTVPFFPVPLPYNFAVIFLHIHTLSIKPLSPQATSQTEKYPEPRQVLYGNSRTQGYPLKQPRYPIPEWTLVAMQL